MNMLAYDNHKLLEKYTEVDYKIISNVIIQLLMCIKKEGWQKMHILKQ